MKSFVYVTSNIDKVNRARVMLAPFKINVQHEFVELPELQSEDGEQIVKSKALAAFEIFNQPLLVNDDTWSIPALRGFPSTNMKSCNKYLKADDWLRLMQGQSDRRIFLISYFAYHDGEKIQVVSNRVEYFFLNEAQGKHQKSSCMEVIAQSANGKSIATEISQGISFDESENTFWSKLAALVTKS